jgi:hypothetical protein
MRRLFSSHKRFIGAGLMSALVIALTVLGAWGFSQMVSAQAGSVVLVHVNPDGSDYTGNDYCPGGGTPIDDDGDTEVDRAIDDCNNIVSQNHVIRTKGMDPAFTPGSFVIEGVGVIVGMFYCGDLDEVTSRPEWDPANDGEVCVVIHSSTPGETRIVFTYYDDATPTPTQYTTEGVVKEWDSLLETVILKADPADEDGDTDIDVEDHRLADQQSTWEDDPVVWDEALKRVRSYPPVELIEIVHGGHEVLIDHETIDLEQPTQGAIIKVWIESTHGCTYFTDPLGTNSFGTMMNGISDGVGRFVGPQVVPDITMPTGLQIPQIDNDLDGEVNEDPVGDADGDTDPDDDGDGLTDEDGPDSNNGVFDAQGNYDYDSIYVDTTCEEQATIHILVGYPDSPGSLKVPVEEWIGINWVTVEEAKQPQIRWAGEQIVLEKRWALPDDWFPNDNCGPDEDELCPVCPLAGLVVQYNREEPSPGGLEEGIPNLNALNAPDSVWTIIDAACISRAMYESEDQGQVNVKALVWDYDYYWGMGAMDLQYDMDLCIDEYDGEQPSQGAWMCVCAQGVGDVDADTIMMGCDDTGDCDMDGDADRDDLDICLDMLQESWLGSLEEGLEPGDLIEVFNKHAFLVWYLKIYQAKLDNIPLDDGDGRADHNAGKWGGEDPIESEGTDFETLNVSQDALLRVTVKGWFEGGNNSGRGAVCVDMDGDGDGDDTTTEDVPGVPYPIPSYEAGCTDPDDEILDHGHWVLPDDLPILAGAYPGFTRQSWDVMNDIDDDIVNDGAIGPKSTLDSHDSVPRPWVPCVLGFDSELWEWILCERKTVEPDLEVTAADALMPPLKIRALIADPADAGFLKEADKDDDVGLDNLYQQSFIPDSPWIPPIVNNGGYDWDSWGWNMFPSFAVLGPYEFYHVFNYPVHLLTDCDEDIPDELCNYDIGNQADQSTSDVTHPRIIEFYTDNRGLGYFFANGDYNLDFFECSIDPLNGTPDCDEGDDVGLSTIQVIADYPYFRKHASVLSNPVDKIWLWGGYKRVTHERIDATHIKVIVNLLDRDGYCKYDVDVNADTTIDVITSPSENPVQGEEIEFILNTEVGSIISVSPNALYNPPAPHDPLQAAVVTGYADGVIIDRSEAVALAEDARVLAGDEDADAVCTAWVVIEHPLGVDPDVSIVLHDPEGDVMRHWPLPALIVGLVQGWNDVCYVGPEDDVEDAMADILEDVLAVYLYDATATDDAWMAYFPDNPDISDLDVLLPYDQLFILMAANADWSQQIQALPDEVDLVGASADDGTAGAWNSVCYAGADKATEEATSDIDGDFEVMYTLGSDQMWRRYVPGRPEIPDTLTTLHRFDSVILLVTAEGGTTWVFDP